MLKTFERRPRLVASTIVTALLLAVSAISPFSGTTALAVPLGSNDIVLGACNNTFQPIKFPLEYDIVARPSANPIAPGSTFTVDFDVTVTAGAAFLNGVYKVLAATVGVSAIPIAAAQATIAPLTGATGAAVVAKLAGTFTIPKPATIPVTADVKIPLARVTGTYTADQTGDVSFTLRGNSWMPTIPAVVGPPAVPEVAADPMPDTPQVFGWTPANLAPPAKPLRLTVGAGDQTYTKISLVSGAVIVYLVCMGGNWTPTPPVVVGDNPTFDAPLIPPVGFAKFAISTGPPITDPSGTTLPPATTQPPVTTAPVTTAPGTTAPATTAPATTAPATTIPSAPVTNTATYTATCTNDVTPDASEMTYEITATSQSPVAQGSTVTITNQVWKATVPESLVTLLKPFLPGGLETTSTGTFTVTNADPGEVDTAPLLSSSPWPESGPMLAINNPADVSFTATGGDMVVAYGGSVTEVDIPVGDGIHATLTCVPTGAVPALFTISVPGDSPETTAPATTAPATTTPGGGGGGGVTTTSVVASLGQIPRTGSNSSVLWVQLFGGLLIMQLGIMMWSTGQGRRRRRVL